MARTWRGENTVSIGIRITAIVQIIAPIFGIVLIGWLAARRGALDAAAVRGLSLFAFNFAIPVLLLRTVAQTQMPPQPEWRFVFAYFSGAFAVFALGALTARLAFGRRGAAPAIFGISACFSNTTILGIPIVLKAFGDAAAVPLALILGFHSALLFTLTTVVAEVGAGVGVPVPRLLRNVGTGLVTNPILWGIGGGLALNFLAVPLPDVLDQLAAMLGGAALPTALFALGANLSRFRLTRTLRESLALTALKTLVQPALIYLLGAYVFVLAPVSLAVAGRWRPCRPVSTPTCSRPATRLPCPRPPARSWSRPWSRCRSWRCCWACWAASQIERSHKVELGTLPATRFKLVSSVRYQRTRSRTRGEKMVGAVQHCSRHANGRLTRMLFGAGVLALLNADPGHAADLGKLIAVSPGKSPFAACTADKVGRQEGVNYPNTEIEPWVDANPANPRNLIAGWQQDRWSNGGSRGDVSGYSKDGGKTWATVLVPGTTLCSGGRYQRASDPWVSISPNGTAYFMTLAFDNDLPIPPGGSGPNAMLVNRSTNGGVSWSRPIVLLADTNPQFFNDKNSLTADPTSSNFAYAVWDRLRDFTVPGVAAAARAGGLDVSMDGVVKARERVKRLKAAAAAAGTAALAPEALPAPATVTFEGPIWFARTIDGGTSWHKAKEIYDPGPDAQTIGNQIVVRPNGTLVNFFTHIFSNGLVRLDLLRSFDKGASFQKSPQFVDVILSAGVVTPDRQELVRDASILFDVAVDPRSGALYAVWQDLRFRGVEEVAFSQSTDGGATWSNAIRINQTPANRYELREQAFIPSIAVGAGGELVVTYYDFRNDTAQGELTDYWAVFCKASCGTRSSWGGERRLTAKSFNMLNAPEAGGLFLGDYMGLVAARDLVHPVFGIATAPDVTTEFTRKISLK